MGQTVSKVPPGEGKADNVVEIGESKLVVDHVVVRRVNEVVRVPVIEEVIVPTTRYEEQVKPTIRYEAKIESTTRFEEVTQPTTRFVVRNEETVRYIPKDVICERPVVTDKSYERPIIIDKEYQLISYKDLDAIKEAMVLLPELLDLVPKLVEEVKALRKVRIVEEIVKVPKIEYVPTTIMRIGKTGELVRDAD